MTQAHQRDVPKRPRNSEAYEAWLSNVGWQLFCTFTFAWPCRRAGVFSWDYPPYLGRVKGTNDKEVRVPAATGTDYDYLRANGHEVVEYHWSGYVLGTLLPYLQEKHQIDLMKAEYDDIAGLLTDATGAAHFIFTPSQSSAFLNRLDPSLYSQDELRDYYNRFNETDAPEIGRAMLDGIAAFRDSLRQLDRASVIVFGIL